MKWTVHGERVIYDSPWVRLALTDVEIPGGPRFEHHVVRMPAEAAGTVVADPDRGVLLLWGHRFAADTWGWEVPAGRIDEAAFHHCGVHRTQLQRRAGLRDANRQHARA